MTVGDACTPTGASCLNLETCNRDKESAKIFLTPGTWRARNKMLNSKHASTRRRTNIITITSRDVHLLMISTNAALSVKNVMTQ